MFICDAVNGVKFLGLCDDSAFVYGFDDVVGDFGVNVSDKRGVGDSFDLLALDAVRG